jgi:hypothetical protein
MPDRSIFIHHYNNYEGNQIPTEIRFRVRRLFFWAIFAGRATGRRADERWNWESIFDDMQIQQQLKNMPYELILKQKQMGQKHQKNNKKEGATPKIKKLAKKKHI